MLVSDSATRVRTGRRQALRRRIWGSLALACLLGGCRAPTPAPAPPAPPSPEPPRPAIVLPAWVNADPLGPGETFATLPDGHTQKMTVADARAAGLLDVDLSDTWAPFILGESDGPGLPVKPNAYRKTFIDLQNDRVDADLLLLEDGPTHQLPSAEELAEQRRRQQEAARRGVKLPPPRRPARPGAVHNYLEPFGIAPTLSVLRARLEEDAPRTCYDGIDREGIAQLQEEIGYISREKSRHDHSEALGDAQWVDKQLRLHADAGVADAGADALAILQGDPKAAPRVARYRRGQARLRAIRAVQTRLVCEGLLLEKTRFVGGLYDLPTHEALAIWERKNDIFGWGIIGGETQAALLRPPADLHLDTFRRTLNERLIDAAGILEDGSALGPDKKPATYRLADGTVVPVPNLLKQFSDALLAALRVDSGAALAEFLKTIKPATLAGLHVAFKPPALPPYYPAPPAAQVNADAGAATTTTPAPLGELDLSVEIDRGDIWYDFPYDGRGKPIDQPRVNYPALTVFVSWQGQKIPLVRWRTTIGSWRSEAHEDGKIYLKYKNSDVGPRIWKNIITGPVWVAPDSTPAKDLLTRKILEHNGPPVTVVNTDVMGPGFQSAYGMVMAIHLQKTPGGGLFDNQIRTHGSVDYTSIARRFSHGCHRLVNNRAVRMFGFVLRHRAFIRQGQQPLKVTRAFSHEGKAYRFEMNTRGYYFELVKPVPVDVLEGHIMGKVKEPITAFMRKPGVDYSTPEDLDETATPITPPSVEPAPVLGP